MTTPLDTLFKDAGFEPEDTLSRVARDEIDAFSLFLDQEIPPKRNITSNLLIATWNIAQFANIQEQWQVPAKSRLSPKRDLRCLWIICEILSRFDVIAVQEVKGNLLALRYAMKVLGPNWSFLMTDVSAGDAGNNERMAFIFDKTRVALSGLAGELVVPDEADEFGFEKDAFKKQFARNPYAVSFKSARTEFILVTAHVDFGNATERRVPELRGIAQWMQNWAENERRWHHNLLVLGDFNLDRTGNKMYEAFTSTGLEVPFILHSFPRTIYGLAHDADGKSYHDQIAWFSKGQATLKNMNLKNGGAIMIYDHLLKDLKLKKASFATRISDHNPLWVEFDTTDTEHVV